MRARFCLGCGGALGTAPEASAEERKIVTVLFCDLVGFTARADGADPEDVRAVLRPYHAEVRVVLERFGGTVEKFIGDAVMAVFGAPVAHEDDAERAVRAGLAVVEAVGELRKRPGLDLAVRVGIATGEALVSLEANPIEGEGFVAGDVVNTAARLESVAPVDGVVVGAATYRLTCHAVDYLERAPVSVKGKTDAVPIWQVVGARSRHGIGMLRSRTQFVGRQDELAVLEDTFSRAVRDRCVQMVMITGEAGVGKSRLVAEFFAAVDARPGLVAWRQGRCLPYGDGITFWALGEIIKAEAGILDTDDPEAARAKLDRAVAAVLDQSGDRAWMVAMLSPLVGLTTGERGGPREEMFTGWRRFFEQIAARQPLVLVIEDLHWADAALLEFLDHLLRECGVGPLLIVGTARPEMHDSKPGWERATKNAVTVPLSRLSDTEIAQLVAALLGTAVLPAETQSLLLAKSGGNPLYAEEFVRLLRDRGVLRFHGRAVVVTDAAKLDLPDTVRAVIAARLDGLPRHHKALLHAAAVVGGVFWSGAVAAVAGVEEAAAREGLHKLAGKEFIHPARTSTVAGQDEYAFWHELVRDVGYSQIPRAARAAKHQASAAWLQEVAGDRVADHAEVLAHHYAEALTLTTAVGAEPANELRDATRLYLAMAGDRAFHLDPDAADAYYRRALALFPADHPTRPAILTKAAFAARASGRTDVAVQTYDAAIEESLKHGDRRTAGGAMARLATLLWDRGDTDASHRLARDALTLLGGEVPCFEQSDALYCLSWLAWTVGRFTEALAWSEQQLGITHALGNEENRSQGLMMRGYARLGLGDPRGLGDVADAVSVMRATLDDQGATVHGSHTLANWLNNLSEARWLAAGTRDALDANREAQEFAVRRGMTQWSAVVRSDGLKVLFDAGQWDDLLREAGNVTASCGTDCSYHYWHVVADIHRAHVLVHRGQLTEAGDLMATTLPQARAIADLQVLGPALEVVAAWQMSRGNLPEAVLTIREFADVTENVPSRRALHLPSLIRICIVAGQPGLAERLSEGMDLRLRRHACAYRASAATLAEFRGEMDTATALYIDAAQEWRSYGHALEHGFALLGSGRCGCRTGDLDAVERLRKARDVFVGLGAWPLVVQTDALLTENAASGS